MSVRITERRVGGDIVIIKLAGDLTLGEASCALCQELERLIQRGEKKVLLDLGDVGYIDTCCINDLVEIWFATITGIGGRLVVFNLNKRVKDLFGITKLYTVFDAEEDEAAAVRRLCQELPKPVPVRLGGLSTAVEVE